MEKISQIIDENFRSGTGKKGPWTLMKIETDTGKQATIFAPANVGDPVKLEYNEQYKNYSANVLTAKKMEAVIEEEAKEDRLKNIEEKLDQILAHFGEQKKIVEEVESAVDLDNLPY